MTKTMTQKSVETIKTKAQRINKYYPGLIYHNIIISHADHKRAERVQHFTNNKFKDYFYISNSVSMMFTCLLRSTYSE